MDPIPLDYGFNSHEKSKRVNPWIRRVFVAIPLFLLILFAWAYGRHNLVIVHVMSEGDDTIAILPTGSKNMGADGILKLPWGSNISGFCGTMCDCSGSPYAACSTLFSTPIGLAELKPVTNDMRCAKFSSVPRSCLFFQCLDVKVTWRKAPGVP